VIETGNVLIFDIRNLKYAYKVEDIFINNNPYKCNFDFNETKIFVNTETNIITLEIIEGDL
jgi:hypothetical protein